MTKLRTAPDVYVKAIAATGMPKGALLYVLATALRDVQTRKKQVFLDVVEAVLRSVREHVGPGDIPTIQEAFKNVANGGDPRDVQVDIIQVVLKAMDELLADGDNAAHWSKQAVRQRVAAFLAMLVAGEGMAANGNVASLEPLPNPHKEALRDYRTLGQAITLAQSVLREYRRDGDAAVAGLEREIEAFKLAAIDRAETAVSKFMLATEVELKSILIGVESKSPDGTSQVVLWKGPPTVTEADLCFSKIREGWKKAANAFVTESPVVRLPELVSIAPTVPDVLPEGAVLHLSRWDRFKMRLKSIGVKAGLIFVGAGAAAALACGFDLSALPSLPALNTFAINSGSATGIGLSLIGAAWTGWTAATGVDARHELKASLLKELEARNSELVAKLIAAYNDSADATVKALREIKDNEIRSESEIVTRILETANYLTEELERRLLSGDATQLRRSVQEDMPTAARSRR